MSLKIQVLTQMTAINVKGSWRFIRATAIITNGNFTCKLPCMEIICFLEGFI